VPRPHYTHKIAAELYAEARSNAAKSAVALAPPDDGNDAVKVTRKRFVGWVREESADPNFLPTLYDRLAPHAFTLPDGTKMRAPTGVQHFREVVKEARPDIYAAVTGDTRPLERAEEVS
jgi:hypothetical protein